MFISVYSSPDPVPGTVVTWEQDSLVPVLTELIASPVRRRGGCASVSLTVGNGGKCSVLWVSWEAQMSQP